MKHFVFDLDGTLVDSFASYFELLERIFAEYGKARGATFKDSLRTAALTDPLLEFFEQHLGADQVAPAMALLQQVSNADASRIPVFAGVFDALEHLRQRGAKIGVWTNRDRESAGLILEKTGLAPFMTSFVSGSCVALRKPHPEGLLRVIAEFGCAPHEVTVVGDHEHDVTAARQAGAHSVRASWHAYWAVEPCHVAHLQFHSSQSFLNWVLSSGT